MLSAIGLSALAVLSACRPQQEHNAEATVQVTGDFGSMPGVDFPTPLPVSQPYTEEVISGSGVELIDGAAVMLAYLAYDAVTGERLVENFTSPPEIRLLGEDTGVLHEELLGRNEGTRLLQVELGTPDRPNPSVLVYDILHTQAWGEPVELPDDAPEEIPALSAGEDGAPQVQVPDADPPADLQVIPVLRGDGAQVRPGQAVTVRYATVSWSTGEVTDTLWGEGMMPTTIPFTGLIPAWQNGLVDEQVGSRVMLLTPPELAFGTDPLVFVIDVLAVSTLDDDVNGEFDEGGQMPDDDDGPAGEDDGDGEDPNGSGDGDGSDEDGADEIDTGDDDDEPAGDEENSA